MSYREALRTGVFIGFANFVCFSAFLTDLDIFYIYLYILHLMPSEI